VSIDDNCWVANYGMIPVQICCKYCGVEKTVSESYSNMHYVKCKYYHYKMYHFALEYKCEDHIGWEKEYGG
jgi:hypothetical protein